MWFLLISLAFGEAVVLERLAASVNQTIILKSDLDKFRQTLTLRAQVDPFFNGSEIQKKGTSATDAEITQYLIDEKICLKNFPVSDAETESEVKNIETLNNLSRDQLRNALTAQNVTMQDYLDGMKVGISKRALQDREIRTRIAITDSDVRQYYDSHYKKGATIPKSFRVRILTTKDRKGLEQTRAALEKGAPESVALSSYEKAGQIQDLGFLSESQMHPKIRKLITKMKDGQWSEILRFDGEQYTLFQRTQSNTDDDQQFEKVKAQIRNQLTDGEFQRQIRLWLERQREVNFVQVASDLPNTPVK